MHCLVIGGSGLVGYELVQLLKKEYVVSFTYNSHAAWINGATGHKINLEKQEPACRLLVKIKPDVVIHAAAPSSVDVHETDKQKAYAINVETTRAIAEKTREIGIKLVYVSTSNIFPPAKRAFYEDDVPAPINFYGACKLGGELATNRNPDSIIVRTDQIYGWNQLPGQKKSFVVSTLEKLDKKQVEVCEDWYNCPTYAKDLSVAIERLVKLDKKGIYHAVGSSYLNRVEWARKIARVFGKDESYVVGIKSETLHLPAIRASVKLDNGKIQKETGLKMRTVDEGLADMKAEGAKLCVRSEQE